MKIATHNGHFHTDELMAVAALLIKFPDAEVVRTRDEEIIKQSDIAVDVGQICDPVSMRFDHHQPGGAGKRENGIPYASFGLVWKEYGAELAGGKEEALVVDEKLVAGIDAADNGVSVCNHKFEDLEEYSIGNFFESFAGRAKSMDELDRGFFESLLIACDLLAREIAIAREQVADWRKVREIYEQSPDKRVIILPGNLSWKRALIPTDAIYAIYFRTDGKWGLQVVPQARGSYEAKRKLPQTWAGLVDAELAKVTGVSDAIFCHSARFLATTLSKEGAIKLAEIALKS
ncbi:TPA: metal-dependent hydrolase [Candidatus Kaiserbacteria bacterium]|uniref:Metal-dependent hydrolase n=1 Tax=Candidatus Zambryskibacteria bacterium RIFCSPHIGHO2_01_FULL_46_25 TaxID=1802738 RepID=A0A1G2T146_9BACT|nr:MAG: hypothetical protein A2838_01060 [Candidatus Zambryskibacteria bacterium RIFCSPHIGHO2_01_FULL_46_25]HCR52283.1 metal-dependent hydrolase [Candidatus Kaiserbacteria bacterium]